MMAKIGSVHEAEAEVLSAEDAIQDAERLSALFRQRRQGGRAVSIRVPLWALWEAIDHLQPEELRQTVERAEKRLAAVGG
jgi:hypothetical protein